MVIRVLLLAGYSYDLVSTASHRLQDYVHRSARQSPCASACAYLLGVQLTRQMLGCPQRELAEAWAAEHAATTGLDAAPPAWRLWLRHESATMLQALARVYLERQQGQAHPE